MTSGIIMPWFDHANFAAARAALSEQIPLLERSGSFDEYRTLLEQELRIVATARLETIRVQGVASIDMSEFAAWFAEHGVPVGDPDAFDDYIEARRAAHQITAWPPGRNEQCWCGSANKYKRCCGALAIPDEDVAERARSLRATVMDVADLLNGVDDHHSDDEYTEATIASALGVLDEAAAQLQDADAQAQAELIEELRYEFFGATHYPLLLELAASSTAKDASGADLDLAPLLVHDLLAPGAPLRSYLHLVYAAALSAEGHDQAALALAHHAFDDLERIGITPTATDWAFAHTYVTDTAAADDAYTWLLAQSSVEEHATISEIACDHFGSVFDLPLAAAWGARHLRAALDATPPRPEEVKRAVTVLRRIYNDADQFADEHPGELRPQRKQPLLDEASAWLDAR